MKLIKKDNSSDITFQLYEDDTVSTPFGSLPFAQNNEESRIIELKIRANAEGVLEGFAFHGNVFANDLINIIFTEELEENEETPLKKLKGINSVNFSLDPDDDDYSFDRKFIVTVIGVN